MGVSAAAAVARARASVISRQVPQGMCLNWVWRMFGAQNSTGYAQGQLTTALNAWNTSRDRHADRNIPIGAPVYFGSSPTRTDKNKHAGDVMIHVGGGVLAGTDVSGANTGFITIDARSKQIQRPYLGWCGDFGGRPIDFGVTVIPAGTTGKPIIVNPAVKEAAMANGNDYTIYALKDGGRRFAAGNGKYIAVGSTLTQETGLDGQRVLDLLEADGAQVRFLGLADYDAYNVFYANIAGETAALV